MLTSDDILESPAGSHASDISATEFAPADGYDLYHGETITEPNSSKAQGKRRAMPMVLDSSSDESESSTGENGDLVHGLIAGSPRLSIGLDVEMPSPSTQFSSGSAMSSLIDLPSAIEAVPDTNTSACALISESVAQHDALNTTKSVDDSNEPLSTRRAKRTRVNLPVNDEALCAAEDCMDQADVRPMITCAGPGCGLMVSAPFII